MKQQKSTTARIPKIPPEELSERTRRLQVRVAVDAQRTLLETLRDDLEMSLAEYNRALERLAELEPWIDGGETPASVERYRDLHGLTYGTVPYEPYAEWSALEIRTMYYRASVPALRMQPQAECLEIRRERAAELAALEEMNRDFESPLDICSVGPTAFAIAAGVQDLDDALEFIEVATANWAKDLADGALAAADEVLAEAFESIPEDKLFPKRRAQAARGA